MKNTEFKYNNNHTYKINFLVWYELNSKEKQAFGEEPYSKEEARKVFDDIYEPKLAHAIRLNMQGILEDVLIEE
jgi:hypothetical protein